MQKPDSSSINVGFTGLQHSSDTQIAIVDLSASSKNEITYKQFHTACDAVANALIEREYEIGTRVALIAQNRAEYLMTFFGIMRAGCVPVPVNVRLPAADIAFVCSDAKARLAFVDSVGSEKTPVELESVRIDVPSFHDTFLRGDASSSSAPAREVKPEDPCLLLYTSGSTGRPKGVLLSNAGQAWFTPRGAEGRRQTPDDKLLTAAPLYHKFGLINAKFSFHQGGTLVLMQRFDPELYVQAIGQYKATWLTGVAAMYEMILAKPGLLQSVDTSSVRAVAVGSSPFSPKLFQRLRECFPKAILANGYGITEAGGGVFGRHPNGQKIPRPVESIGYPLDGLEAKLVPVDGETNSNGNEGVLWVRSPGVMIGYNNRPEETAKRVDKDGWLDTGDVCRRDENGYYFFVRRVDDMFKCGGENVHPRQIQTLLESHPDVIQAAVVAVDDPTKGQVPVAFVVKRSGADDLTEESLKAWTIERGPAYQHPRRVFFEEALPVAGTFKVDLASLRTRANERAR
jgi:long-chain acyl-CoA synthetase